MDVPVLCFVVLLWLNLGVQGENTNTEDECIKYWQTLNDGSCKYISESGRSGACCRGSISIDDLTYHVWKNMSFLRYKLIYFDSTLHKNVFLYTLLAENAFSSAAWIRSVNWSRAVPQKNQVTSLTLLC